MKIRLHFNTLPLLALLGGVTAAEGQVQPQLAQRWFAATAKLCERDAGRLWGKSLCGPMVIFDQATNTHATSQPEPEGPLPRFPGIADGPVSWGGLRWFAVPWYMFTGKTDEECERLLLHGLFHRIQSDLGFTADKGFNEHLDTLEGRVWMQLEWRALRRALESSGSDRGEAVADALAFRRERRRLFPGAAENERRDEIVEGLPSYTEVAAWADSPADARRAAAPPAIVDESIVGAFPYTSGRAYGVLLDDLLPGWRRQVRATSDLGEMLTAANNRPPTANLAVAAARYDAATLRTAEEARDRERQGRVAELRRRFIDGPVLTMPAPGRGTSDSTGAVGIAGAGTVYFHEYTLSARWGSLKANGGVLRAADGSTLSVPVTGPLDGTTLRGDGWSVTLNSGWVVRPAGRSGSFTIVPEK